MRKFSAGLIIGLLVGLMMATASIAIAGQAIKLIVNGQEINCDVPPQNINGRVLVPARYVAEALGASVEWDSVNNAVVITGISQTTNTTNNTSTVDDSRYPDANNNGIPDWVEDTSNPPMPTGEEVKAR